MMGRWGWIEEEGKGVSLLCKRDFKMEFLRRIEGKNSNELGDF
jgi:hypothetical protein